MAGLKALRPTLPVLIAEMFGLRRQAMIQGLAFMSHQLGSFLGAYGGGLIYDALGSYDMAWRRRGRPLRRDHPDCLRADPPVFAAAAEGSVEPDCSTFRRLLAKELAKGQECCRMPKTESEMVQALASICGWHGFWIGIAQELDAGAFSRHGDQGRPIAMGLVAAHFNHGRSAAHPLLRASLDPCPRAAARAPHQIPDTEIAASSARARFARTPSHPSACRGTPAERLGEPSRRTPMTTD
jgi:hypothetical protein